MLGTILAASYGTAGDGAGAFVDEMDALLVTCAGVAVVAIGLPLAFLSPQSMHGHGAPRTAKARTRAAIQAHALLELNPIDAVRGAMRDVYAQLSPEQLAGEQERQKLAREVRARTLEQYASGLDTLTEAFAERLGKPADSVEIRVIAGAIIGVGLAAILADDADRMDEYFQRLAQSLER